MCVRSLALIGVTILLAGTTTQAAKPADFGGTYVCIGLNPNGSEYALQMRIRPFKAVLSVDQVSQAGELFPGVGYVHRGDLAVAFAVHESASVIVYTHSKNQLKGPWGVFGLDRVMTETCTKTDKPFAPQRPPGHEIPSEQVRNDAVQSVLVVESLL